VTKRDLLGEFQVQAKKTGFEIQTAKASSLGDYLLHRKAGIWALLVLVKGRWWAERNLLGQNIWIAFPDGGKASPRQWYVVPHDVIVAHGKIRHKDTLAWKNGLFHKPRLSKELVEIYQQYKIEALAGYAKREEMGLIHEIHPLLAQATSRHHSLP
jgi:hypothetical protein